MPLRAAACLTTQRNVIRLSAQVSASAWRKSISCWPTATSWCEASRSKPRFVELVLDVAARVLGEIVGIDVEVRGLVVRVERRPVLLAALEEEELRLGPDRHVVALGLGVREHLLELHARVARERRAVRIGDVADDARRLARLALAPGQHLERVRVRVEVHVGLLDALEPADRGAVEHQLVVEGLLELRGGNRDVLQLAVQLRELQADELDVVLATALDQLALVHLVSSSRREHTRRQPTSLRPRLHVPAPGHGTRRHRRAPRAESTSPPRTTATGRRP